MLSSNKFQLSSYSEFVQKALEYPPLSLFCGLSNPSAKEKKLEQRIIQLCESVYFIDNFMLAELRNASREFNVLYSMKPEFLKDTYCITVASKFDSVLKLFLKDFSVLGKSEPQLKTHIESILGLIKKEETIFSLINADIGNNDLKKYAELYKTVSKEETERLLKIKERK